MLFLQSKSKDDHIWRWRTSVKSFRSIYTVMFQPPSEVSRSSAPVSSASHADQRLPSAVSQAQLDGVAQRLNQRPRKTLDFETPADRLQKVLQ
ncbi:hypothetical protein EOA24_02100 [Mesorhizobium sp. M2A.F.Ca.ET.039.01.1.1]|nr:hypothetical protein EOA24_02100 [Mesorhizobium sp. M2A.F.Ca.ET.039.01.1.1]